MLSFAMLPSLDIFHKGNEHGGHRTLKYRWLQKNLDKSMLNQQHRLQHRPCSVAVCLVFEWRIERRIQSTCGQRQGVGPARDVGKRAPKSSADCQVRAGKPPALVCSVYRSKELEDIHSWEDCILFCVLVLRLATFFALCQNVKFKGSRW